MAGNTGMPQAGEVIAGKYRLEEPLSAGGMGQVFVARHTETHRPFAVKVMTRELAGDAEAEARFVREARLAGQINHPAVIQVYDVGRHGDHPYMVMKLLEGESLGERLKRGPIRPDKAVAIIMRILDGMAAAHDQGVVHRDLKPDNIFLCPSDDGRTIDPTILDFGISKLLGAEGVSQRLTATGIALGTPLYMSIEQVRGAKDVDRRTDVYSLGVILYEMLTGRVPFRGESYGDLVLKIMEGKAPAPIELDPTLPPALSDVVMRAMSTDREARYPDARSMADDLAAVFTLQGVPSDRPRVSRSFSPETITPFGTEARQLVPVKRTGTYAALGIAAVVLAAAAALLFSGSETPTEPVEPVTAAPAPPAPPPLPPATGTARPLAARPLPGLEATKPEPPKPTAPAAQPPAAAKTQPAQAIKRPEPKPEVHAPAPRPDTARPAAEPAKPRKRPTELIDPW